MCSYRFFFTVLLALTCLVLVSSAASADFSVSFSYGSVSPYTYYYPVPVYTPYYYAAPVVTYQAPVVITPSPLLWADADRWNYHMWNSFDRVYNNYFGSVGFGRYSTPSYGYPGSFGGYWNTGPGLPGVPLRGFDAGSTSIPQHLDRYGR